MNTEAQDHNRCDNKDKGLDHIGKVANVRARDVTDRGHSLKSKDPPRP